MRIDWDETVAWESLLPPRHPLRGILGGDEALRWRDRYFFAPDIAALPSPRRMDEGLLRRLEEWHRGAGAPAASLASLRLLGEGAQAVVTGQQAGLLGGPLLTLLKGITAVVTAGRLTALTGRPHVPVFWSETDDHDHEEVNQAWTLDATQSVQTFSLPWPEGRRGGPTGRLPLGEEAARLVEDFLAASGPTEFTPALRLRMAAELEGAGDLSHWFARQVLGLLGSRGLVVFDALEEGFKPFAADLWVRVLEDPLGLTGELQAAGEALSAAGYTPVLAKKRRRCPFFLVEGGRRETVFFERDAFRAGGRTYTHLELRRRLEERAGDFSAGVNLRPLLQDWLLPTAVYVGGPTELAYFQQVFPGYGWAEMEPPALLLRGSVTFVEPPVRKTLLRQGIDAASLRSGVEGVIGALVRREERLADPARWERLREGTLRPLRKLAGGLGEAEAEIAELCRKTEGKADFLLRELEKKSVAAIRRRQEVTRGQLERARDRLFPRGNLQERVLSPYFFLNKYGDGLVAALVEAFPRDFTLHHFGSIIP